MRAPLRLDRRSALRNRRRSQLLWQPAPQVHRTSLLYFPEHHPPSYRAATSLCSIWHSRLVRVAKSAPSSLERPANLQPSRRLPPLRGMTGDLSAPTSPWEGCFLSSTINSRIRTSSWLFTS